ncbi:MAG TPA: DUF5060 domain-containing protein [Planctomycetota bacterium]|nr:DUF5060 domain-containing protein [Planctomycetota bacterium]
MRLTTRFYRGNAKVAALAIVLFLGAAALFVRDVYKTMDRATAEAPAVKLSREALAQVTADNGWFPYRPEPLYDWEGGTQGWMLEQDFPLAMNSALRMVSTDPDSELPPGPTETSTPQGKAPPAGAAKLAIVESHASQGRKSLSVPVRFPDPVTIIRANNIADGRQMVGVRFIAYDVWVPPECPGFVGCLFFMKDKDGLWYQARSRAALLPGQWTTVTADIRGGSPDVTPLGHQGQWDDNQAMQIRTIGLTFYGDKEFNGSVLVDNFRGWQRAAKFLQPSSAPIPASKKADDAKLRKLAETYKEPPLRVLNLRTEPADAIGADGKSAAPQVKKFDTLTVRFELNRQVNNPFDPDMADVTCLVETPSHQKLEHVGYWYQDYDRSDRFAGDDLAPIGRPEWRVRITPREAGDYHYTITVKIKTGTGADGQSTHDTLTVPARAFTALSSNEKGFVRVSKQNPHFFEFENGEFYYPIGHNVHTTVDMRCWNQILHSEAPADRGLPMYADFFPKMKAAGENTAEVWMASWWVGIEWTSKWRDYYGRNRYSLQHAWKLDRLLDMARENGIHVHLVLDNHGKFSSWCDWEWENNPYNMRTETGSSGVCRGPRDFFTNDLARTSHRNKLRYIAARWGADPTIMGFELCSEFDLVGGMPVTSDADIKHKRSQGERGHVGDPNSGFFRTPEARNWVREMMAALRHYDPYDHLVSNHYATDYTWVDTELAKEAIPSSDPAQAKQPRPPLFDYIVTDAYRQTQPMGYVVPARAMEKWYNGSIAPYLQGQTLANKPFWITEYGGDFNGAVETCLNADIHCGLWATWMTDGAGTPLMWWFDFIDQRNHYAYYKAFAAYVAGEDRRMIQGGTCEIINGAPVTFQAYKWPTGAYAWVFDPQAMMSMPAVGARQHFSDIHQTLTGLTPGKYRIEYWDTYEGVMVKAEDGESVKGSGLKLAFPPFVNDMAVKVKAAK